LAQRVVELGSHPIADWLATADIRVVHASSFYTAPMSFLPPHIDSDLHGDWCKLNLIFGGPGLMTWYTTSDPGKLMMTPDGLPFTHLDKTSCTRVCSTTVDRSSLVNTGRPHSLLNISKQPRWALSMVLSSTTEDRLLTVEEAYAKLGTL
jgi:hypothetical protein